MVTCFVLDIIGYILYRYEETYTFSNECANRNEN